MSRLGTNLLSRLGTGFLPHDRRGFDCHHRGRPHSRRNTVVIVNSVLAVLTVSDDVFIVYTSNAFTILGLWPCTSSPSACWTGSATSAGANSIPEIPSPATSPSSSRSWPRPSS